MDSQFILSHNRTAYDAAMLQKPLPQRIKYASGRAFLNLLRLSGDRAQAAAACPEIGRMTSGTDFQALSAADTDFRINSRIRKSVYIPLHMDAPSAANCRTGAASGAGI